MKLSTSSISLLSIFNIAFVVIALKNFELAMLMLSLYVLMFLSLCSFSPAFGLGCVREVPSHLQSLGHLTVTMVSTVFLSSYCFLLILLSNLLQAGTEKWHNRHPWRAPGFNSNDSVSCPLIPLSYPPNNLPQFSVHLFLAEPGIFSVWLKSILY